MSRTLRLRLNKESIGTAIREAKEYREALVVKAAALSRRLAEIGVEVARVRFTEAAYDGDNDVAVHVEYDGNKAAIVASGRAVAFIEFGAGVYFPEHPSGLFAHGTYGQGKGAQPKGWIYRGDPGTGGQPVRDRHGNEKPGVYRTYGNPPAMAMWGAAEEMAAAVERIAQEVFGQ